MLWSSISISICAKCCYKGFCPDGHAHGNSLLLAQAVYTLLGGETLTLTEMIVIMGVVCMVMSQIPTMHALWTINLLNLISVFIFTYMAIAVAVWQTCYYKLPRDYGVHGSTTEKAFGVFQGIVIMHFAYG